MGKVQFGLDWTNHEQKLHEQQCFIFEYACPLGVTSMFICLFLLQVSDGAGYQVKYDVCDRTVCRNI